MMKKYRLSFSKVNIPADSPFKYYLVNDYSIINALEKLKSEYDIEVISYNLKHSIYVSNIRLRCDSSKMSEILAKFTESLSGAIEEVKMRRCFF